MQIVRERRGSQSVIENQGNGMATEEDPDSPRSYNGSHHQIQINRSSANYRSFANSTPSGNLLTGTGRDSCEFKTKSMNNFRVSEVIEEDDPTSKSSKQVIMME